MSVCQHGEVRSTRKECMTSSARSVAVSSKSTVSVSSIRHASSRSMVESRQDSMYKNEKRKREDKGSEPCGGVNDN